MSKLIWLVKKEKNETTFEQDCPYFCFLNRYKFFINKMFVNGIFSKTVLIKKTKTFFLETRTITFKAILIKS